MCWRLHPSQQLIDRERAVAAKRRKTLKGKARRTGRGIDRESFAALISTSEFAKIEATLSLPRPSTGFRDWLLNELWHFYQNADDHAGNSRAILKKELLLAAQLATEFKLGLSPRRVK